MTTRNSVLLWLNRNLLCCFLGLLYCTVVSFIIPTEAAVTTPSSGQNLCPRASTICPSPSTSIFGPRSRYSMRLFLHSPSLYCTDAIITPTMASWQVTKLNNAWNNE